MRAISFSLLTYLLTCSLILIQFKGKRGREKDVLLLLLDA